MYSNLIILQQQSWTFDYKFDFIHSRMMTGSIRDWEKLINQGFENLTSGGWVQISDMDIPLRCDDNTMGSNIDEWGRSVVGSTAQMGLAVNSARSYKRQLIAVGFEDVQELVYNWPMNRWPKNPRMKELGTRKNENMRGDLSGLSVAIFTRVLGWIPEATELFLDEVKREMNDMNMHTYFAI
ncbi:hypothetical protein DL98DRAFT_608450 [Cadophora sp. DSE1049]|nr:hypothetical protein DL98DRAFT_608450 [Cadophora sp. DSE1049]